MIYRKTFGPPGVQERACTRAVMLRYASRDVVNLLNRGASLDTLGRVVLEPKVWWR